MTRWSVASSAGLKELSCRFTLLLLFVSNLKLAHSQSSPAGSIVQQPTSLPAAHVSTIQLVPPSAVAPIITPLLATLGGASKVASSLASNQQQQQHQKPASAAVDQPPKLNGTLVAVPPHQSSSAAAAPTVNSAASPPTLVLPQSSNINLDEPITQLDYSNINEEILNKNTANLLYFNADFNKCRNCDKFFATWKELALDIRWWRHVVRLFVINCSDDDNVEVCRRAGASEFPQLRFYWVRSNSLSQDGQRLRILGKSVHAMRHLITDKLMDSYLEHNRMLAQKNQPRAGTTTSNPFSALTSLAMSPVGGGLASGGGGSDGGPLTALMSLLSQFLGSAGSNSSPGQVAPNKLLSGVMSLMDQTATGKSSGPPPSLASIMNGNGGVQGFTQIVDALIGLASWRRSLTLQPLPINWPELEPIDATNTQSLLRVLPTRAGSLLVMETQDFLYIGLEVMLDLNPYSNQTYIARVRDDRSHLTKNLTQRDDIQAPALIYVSERREINLIMTAPKYANDEDLRKAFVKAFDRRQSRHLKRVWSTGQLRNQQATSKSQEDEEILLRMNNVYMNDLLNTIRASLLDQVLRHTDLSDDQYNALVRYVSSLINYFPFRSDDHVKFFKRLHAWLQIQVSPLDMVEYKKQFHDIDYVLGEKREWIACKSLSSINTISDRSKKFSVGSLFEDPPQLGKVVSNITRLFRTNQQKIAQLKNLAGAFISPNSSPVILTNNNNNNQQPHPEGELPARDSMRTLVQATTTSTSTTAKPHKEQQQAGESNSESSTERLVKSLTSGSLGSDSSILKLISSALTGGGDGDGSPNSRSPKTFKSKYAREYSCGLWKLAHVMVVNEYNKDSPRKDVKHVVLRSLYQYMLQFYACSACGNRVRDVSSEFKIQPEDHLQDQADSIMMLWKWHNRVNKRLEAETRPGLPPKVQFPPESLCPRCRTLVKARPDDANGSNPSWTERFVLPFLIRHYSSSNIIMEQGDEISSSSSSGSSASALVGSDSIGSWLAWLTLIVSCLRTMSILILRDHVDYLAE